MRRADARRPVDQPLEDAGLIADFVQPAEAAADVGVRDLPDQRQHRRVHAVGGDERRAAVEQARARHHRVGLRPVGGERGAERHIGRALLMARVHGAQLVARLEHGVEQIVVMHAGERVDRVDAVGEERRNGRFPGRHALHGLNPS